MSGHAVVTWVTGGESDPLAILDAGNFVKVAEANYALPHAKEYARLIAAAPELLEALRTAMEWNWLDDDARPSRVSDMCEAAITKATQP